MAAGCHCAPAREGADWPRNARSRGGDIVDTEAIDALLVRAAAAHGEFEETELQGVYDQAWPRWYATYAVEHGIGRARRPSRDHRSTGRVPRQQQRRVREDRARAPGAVGDLHGGAHQRGTVVTTAAGEQHAHPPASDDDDGVGGVAARARRVRHRERPARPCEVPLEPGESSIEGLESGDPIGDVGAALADEPRQLGGRVGAVAGMAPACDPARHRRAGCRAGAGRSAGAGARRRARRTRGSRCPVARPAAASRTVRRSARCRSTRRLAGRARRSSRGAANLGVLRMSRVRLPGPRTAMAGRRPTAGDDARRGGRMPPPSRRGSASICALVDGRAARRTPSGAEAACRPRSARGRRVAATGPRPGTASRQPTWSYGCQSTISSSVASRPVTHWAIVPTPRRPPGEVSSMTSGPSHSVRSAGEVRWAQTTAGPRGTVVSRSRTTSASATSRRRTPVSACQRASRSRVNVATRPRCSIDSSARRAQGDRVETERVDRRGR